MHHDAQVDDFKVVALQHDADDIFADVMNVALHRGQQDFPVIATAAGFFRLDVGLQVGNGLFHDTGGLDHLGQEHFSFTKEVAHGIHPVHQGTLYDLYRCVIGQSGGLGILFNELDDALEQRVLKALCHWQLAPLEILGFRPAFLRLQVGGHLQ